MSKFEFVTPELENMMLEILATNRIDPTHDKMNYGQMKVCRDAFKKEHRDIYMQIITNFSKGEFEGWIKTLYWKHKKLYTKPPRQKMVLNADIEKARSIELNTKNEVLHVNHRGLPQVPLNTIRKAEKLGLTIVGSLTTRLYQIRRGGTVLYGENWDLKPSNVVNLVAKTLPEIIGEPCDLIGLNIPHIIKKMNNVVKIVGEGKELEEYRRVFIHKYHKDSELILTWWNDLKNRYTKNHRKLEFTYQDTIYALIKRYLEKRAINNQKKLEWVE